SPVWEWLPRASWLLYPAVALIGAVILLGRALRRPTQVSRSALYFQVQFGAMVLMFGFLDRWKSTALIQMWYYASLLLPAIFLAFGGQLGDSLRQLRPFQFRVVMLVAAVLLVASAVAPALRYNKGGLEIPLLFAAAILTGSFLLLFQQIAPAA